MPTWRGSAWGLAAAGVFKSTSPKSRQRSPFTPLDISTRAPCSLNVEAPALPATSSVAPGSGWSNWVVACSAADVSVNSSCNSLSTISPRLRNPHSAFNESILPSSSTGSSRLKRRRCDSWVGAIPNGPSGRATFAAVLPAPVDTDRREIGSLGWVDSRGSWAVGSGGESAVAPG